MTPEQIEKLQQQIKKGISSGFKLENVPEIIHITPKTLLEIGNRASTIFSSYKGFKGITPSQIQVAIIIQAFNDFLPENRRLPLKFKDSND